VENASSFPNKNTRLPFGRLGPYLHFGSPFIGYLLSIVLTVAAWQGEIPFLVKTQATPPFNFIYPAFTLFYPAIALSAFAGGIGPGVMANILTAAFGIGLFPRMPGPVSWISLSVLGPALTLISARVRRLSDRHRASTRDLARFKFIGDHASDWLFLIGMTGAIRYANRTACLSLGWSDEELNGRNFETLVTEPQRAALREVLQNARSGPVHSLEVNFQRNDGTTVLTELICTCVSTPGDQVIHAAARDITERRQIEQKVREMRNWESLGVMAGGLAHDFNNLLMIVIGNAELARDFLPRDHEARKLLDDVASAGERSADLVRLMLATSGYREGQSVSLDLDHMLSWILSSRTLPENVNVVREAEPVTFMGDRQSIETLLWNLIANAAESYENREGIVKVTIRKGGKEQPGPEGLQKFEEFEDGDFPAGEYITLIVEDHGSGMTPATLQRAFDPFFTTKFTGRGLGLPAVRGIVRAYNGKLRALTSPGAGTIMEIRLPIKNPAIDPQENGAPAKQKSAEAR
jgi:PAS domain S-box-containing protein